MSEITYQQKLVYERLNLSLKTIYDANQKIETKATTILTGSIALTGFICGGKLLPISGQPLGIGNCLLLCFICTTSVLLAKKCMAIISPTFSGSPGSLDINELYDNVITVEENYAFNQAITDLESCIKKEIDTNNSKSEKLICMITCLYWQLGFLIALVVWNSIPQCVYIPSQTT
jgi:hypothetical protein